jgi:hypothetical protein
LILFTSKAYVKASLNDRLFAAGLIAFTATIFLCVSFFSSRGILHVVDDSVAVLLLLGGLAMSGIVVAVSPLVRGGTTHRVLALLFILPSVVLLMWLVQVLVK